MNECALEPRVPIYLVVSGCAMVSFLGFYKLRLNDIKRQTFEDRLKHYATIIALVTLLFYFIWLICGKLHIYL